MKAVNLPHLYDLKTRKARFPVLTVYDASFAAVIEQAGIEVVLVGDSLGNVIQGQDSTVPVTVDEMAYHTAAVRRGNSKSLLITDMPYMSYSTIEQTLHNAAHLMQVGAQMVKLEGGAWLLDSVHALTERGIPVCGHLGLTPQSVSKLGGYRVQGRDTAAAEQMLADAQGLQEAGADLVVLECVPSALGAKISSALEIPVIGIGAGPDTDAQVLVLYDLLGIAPSSPKFSRNFMSDHNSIAAAIEAYAEAVRNGRFPAPEHCFN